MLEFALIATPLFVLLLGMIVLGVNLMALGVLNAATKEAGRQIQIGAIRGSSDSDVRTLICNYMSSLAPSCSSTLMIYVASGATFGAVQAATVVGTAFSPVAFSPGTNGSSVLMQVAYRIPFGLADVKDFTLTSTTVFKNEP